MTSSSSDTPGTRIVRPVDGLFPRLQLPPVPVLGHSGPAGAPPLHSAPPPSLPSLPPATDLDGNTIGGRDEPLGGWQMPSPEPDVTPAVAVPVPAQPRPIPAAAPPPAPIVQDVVTACVPASPVHGPSSVAVVLLAVLAAVLVGAGALAFSAALPAFAALLVSQLAIAASLVVRADQPRPRAATCLAVLAGAGAAFAAWQAVGQFSQVAFVAGLLVLASGVVALLLLGIASLVLHRRGEQRTLGDEALRSGTVPRFLLLAAVLVAGVQAHHAFSATADGLVALAIVAVVALNVASVLNISSVLRRRPHPRHA
jgi:hypothetical protein